jgi:hypothetical protein
MLCDADKCKLINLKEELEVFLLNRAVCYSISQSSIRKEFEEGIEFFKKQIDSFPSFSIHIQDCNLQSRFEIIDQCTKRFKKLKQCRLSTVSHKKLSCLCELLYSKILLLDNFNHNTLHLQESQEKSIEIDQLIVKAEKDIENKSIEKIPLHEQKLLFKEWKRLLYDLRSFLSTLTLNENQHEKNILTYQTLEDRLKKYEHDLIMLHQKNEYRDTMYIEFYKVSKALYTIDPVSYKTLQKNSENFDFYNDINTTEMSLRTQIKHISNFESDFTSSTNNSLSSINSINIQIFEENKSSDFKKFKSPQKRKKTISKRKRILELGQESQEQKSETYNNKFTFLKRGGPKYCPGCPCVNSSYQPHTCQPKTVFFPFLLDKIERCFQCHEQIVLFNGGKIQNSLSKKRKS